MEVQKNQVELKGKPRYRQGQLAKMRRHEIHALCVQEFGADTAQIYHHYTKGEMMVDLLTIMVEIKS